MQRANGSRVVSAAPMLVQLGTGAPGVPPMQLQVWPDWEGAPSEGAALTSVLVLAIMAAHQTIATLANRLAALEVLAAESARSTVQRFPDGVAYPIEPGERHRDEAKHALALAAVQSIADKIEITASPVLAPDDTVGAPASALDLLGVKDGPAPVGVSGPTDDGN